MNLAGKFAILKGRFRFNETVHLVAKVVPMSADQQELTDNSSAWTQNVVWKIYCER